MHWFGGVIWETDGQSVSPDSSGLLFHSSIYCSMRCRGDAWLEATRFPRLLGKVRAPLGFETAGPGVSNFKKSIDMHEGMKGLDLA